MVRKRGASQGDIVTAPAIISDLVDKFTEHCESYHRAGYNETLLRRDFLDPFFEALETAPASPASRRDASV
jgi:hypothetical protein